MNRTSSAHEPGPTDELLAQAADILAYGGLHRALLRPIYELEDAAFPQLAVAARGYELVDSDGRVFIDWMNAWGPVILGYRHPAVEQAIADQLAAGPSVSLMHPIEIEVASMLVEMVPSADMVAFGKNGSDVLNAAIRVARAVTGRELVLQHGFHGFHDWYTCMHGARGVLPVLREYVHPFPYNDLGALEQLFDEFDDRVAAVVMEPTNSVLPDPGYLEGVRELTRSRGALLVFDEMVTGFRLANGGAQELFGVTPDLTCLGKAIANGMPLSAIVGTREYMKVLPEVGFGMTFRGETLSLAAARAVLSTLRDEPVTEHLSGIGRQLKDGLARASADTGIRSELMGPDARLTLAFWDHGPVMREDLTLAFILECARHGVLTNGMVLPSYAHDEAAVTRTIAAFEAALGSLAETAAAADSAMRDAMRAGFSMGNGDHGEGLATGWIDVMRVDGEQMSIAGWMLLDDGWPDVVEFVSATGERLVAEPEKRPDLRTAFPQIDGSENGGYRVSLPKQVFGQNGTWDITIRGQRDAETVFSCRIKREHEPARALRAPHWSGDTMHVYGRA